MADLHPDPDDEAEDNYFRLLHVWSDLAMRGIEHAYLSEAEALNKLLIAGDHDAYEAEMEVLLDLEVKRRDYFKPKIVQAVPKVKIPPGTPVFFTKGDDGQMYAEPTTFQGQPRQPHGLYVENGIVIVQGVFHFPTPTDAPDIYLRPKDGE